MKAIQKSLIGILVLAMIAGTPLYSGLKLDLSAKLYGGLGTLSTGDLNTYYRSLQEWDEVHHNPVKGEYGEISTGLNMGAELFWNFRPNLAAVLGFGYIGAAKESRLTRGSGEFEEEEVRHPKVSAIPITLGVAYNRPLTSKISVNASGGIGYYLGKVRDTYLSRDADSVYDQSWESSKAAFGLQGGIGLEYALQPKISLTLDIVGRMANLKGLKGTEKWTSEGPGYSFEYQQDVTLWYVEYPDGDHTYTWILFEKDKPEWERYKNVREGEISLSGLAFRIGVKYRF